MKTHVYSTYNKKNCVSHHISNNKFHRERNRSYVFGMCVFIIKKADKVVPLYNFLFEEIGKRRNLNQGLCLTLPLSSPLCLRPKLEINTIC